MKKKRIIQTLLTNLVLIFLVCSVSFVCFVPADSAQVSAESCLYRSGRKESGGISLMFNVYWGQTEVYQILDILDEYSAKSTFFIGGCWADDHVACLKEIVSRGHELGNHGYFHKDHDKLSLAQNREEIVRCNQFIQLAVGESPTLFAPPSGAYNDATLSICKALKMKAILWTKDTIDWRDKDEQLIYARATQGVDAGAFVLMHPMKATVRALPNILKEYQSRNLRAITVRENLAAGG